MLIRGGGAISEDCDGFASHADQIRAQPARPLIHLSGYTDAQDAVMERLRIELTTRRIEGRL
jgi:hypothetical protein